MNWYKNAYLLNVLKKFAYVELVGSGLSQNYQIPGTGQSLNGNQLMNEVVSQIGSILNQNGVVKIDTSPTGNPEIAGYASSIEVKPGIVHVDIARIFQEFKVEPSTYQQDGMEPDSDAIRHFVNAIKYKILQRITEVSSHESRHIIDFKNTKNPNEVKEEPAIIFGKEKAKQFYPEKFNQ